ncbi:glycosyl hydrolase 53 family protein [Paenibacillus sp. CF384]|uniref:glycosyl hydrolase 53 family protein n=1 Tax=Paenibacillus sp. CF384 TaxID=1884382 RepID=UPI00089A15FD|nr:glycosyl hydrolase 53 family protein [Paenibacillus sp. CF384]SDX08365.1 arabinogalactan endo-1,4-beta-galactosidase [Paenibacillus sp. CF384]
MNRSYHPFRLNRWRQGLSALTAVIMLLSMIISAVAVPGKAGAAAANALTNPGFEDGLNGWDYTSFDGSEPGPASTLSISGSDKHSGASAASYWNGSAYAFKLSQTVSGLTDGTYTLKAWSSGDAGNNNFKLYADNFCGSEKLTTDITNSGWGTITPYTVEEIQVTNGQATIGFEVNSLAGKWGFFDDVELVKVEEPEEPTVPSDEPFIKGADISSLQAIEDAGGKYYEGGIERDLLDILKDHGVNYVRLRIWNDPVDADGYNDKAHIIEMAQRVKAKGMKLLLDFHYSDFWADPGKQVKPEAWTNLSFDELKQAVYDYTADVMNGLKAVDAYPDMVQIGNEINPGMLLPDGSTSDYSKLTALLKQGIQAVRDTTPAVHKVKIMLHLAEGGNNWVFRSFFDAMETADVDYDVIGMSFYPFWHGPFQTLKDNLNDMADRYGKQVIVAETSYGFTVEDGDGYPNNFTQKEADEAGFPATVEGQKQVLTTVMNTVAHVPGGKGAGVFYWEPAWIPVPKDSEGHYQAGWKSGEGASWDNQALFDFQGNVLPSLDAFQFEPGDLDTKTALTAKNPEGISVPVNESAETVSTLLPAAADVLYNDGSIEPAAVEWSAIEQDDLSRIGTFVIDGQITGTELAVKVPVTVTTNRNLLHNGSFEDGTAFASWTVTDATEAAKVKTDAANAYAGTKAVNYYASAAFDFTMSQTVTGLTNGTYLLKAKISGGGGDNAIHLSAQDFGAEAVQSDNIVNTGWQNWNDAELSSIQVTNGQVTIGLTVDAPADTWGWIDSFELYRETPVAGWTEAKAVTASNVGTSSVKLTWTGAADANQINSYKIYKDGKLLTTVTAGSATEYTVTGLSANTAYSFKVEASLDDEIWTSTGPSTTVQTAQEAGPVIGPVTSTNDSAVFTITASGLSANAEGKVEVALPIGKTTVTLPSQTAELLGTHPLTLNAEKFTLTIPSSVFQQLAALGGSSADSTITLTLAPLEKDAVSKQTDLLEKQNQANITLIGQVYAFKLSIRLKDGKETNLTQFKEPLTIHFSSAGITDPEIAGIFYLADDGKMEYIGGTREAATGSITADIHHFSKYALLQVEQSFTDVSPQHWAYKTIRQLAAKQAMNGTVQGRFEPSRTITRAEFAALLVKALKLQLTDAATSSAAVSFTDVPAEAWFAPYVAKAAQVGVITGRSAESFDPNNPITREEMAVLTMRAYEVLNASPTKVESAEPFADQTDVSAWAATAIDQASALGLIQGQTAGKFAPQAPATRAEAAQVIWNVLKR